MKIDFFGPNYNFFKDAFFGPIGFDTVLLGGASSTMATYLQPTTGVVTTFTGQGLTLDAFGKVSAGTITGISFSQGGVTLAAFSDMSWSAVGFFTALQAISAGNQAPYLAMFNSSPVTFDASSATVPWIGPNDGASLTTDMTFITSAFNDTVIGGRGNDRIVFGGGSNDLAIGSAGNDTYVFTDLVAGDTTFVRYGRSAAGISVTINEATNQGSVVKSTGVDTFIDIANPLNESSLFIYGTDKNDAFTIDAGPDNWIAIAGAEGNDTFNLILDSWIRLHFNWNGYNVATQALNLNVAAGVVYNDGFGFQDTLNITPGGGVLQFYTTAFDDVLIGSANREDFNLQLGADSVDGGGGEDRVRYDRHGVDLVSVDLVAGTAQGEVGGIAFSHRLKNIEDIKGSYSGNDTLKGNNGNNEIQGMGGDDTLIGRAGQDSLSGGDGNDTLNGGNGNDVLSDGAGDDTVNGGAGNDVFYNWGGSDTFDGGKGRDTFAEDSANWSEVTPATLEMNMVKGVHGALGSAVGQDKIARIENYSYTGDWAANFTGNAARNVVKTDKGNDWVNGNRGNDGISTGAGNDTLLGGAGRDKLFAGNGRDLLNGGKHNDVLNGGEWQ